MDGNKIKTFRNERKISLSHLSELTGISKSYLSLLERGIQKNPSIDIIEKIARALKVDQNCLLKPTNVNNRMLKLEISLSENEMNKEKLNQIKQLITLLGKE